MNEITPLNQRKVLFHSSVELDDSNTTIASTNTVKETKFLCVSSIPLIITFLLQYSLTVVSIFSVGHIGKTELAAVSLAIMTFNVTVSIYNGMASCLETFCSQAYGAKKYHLVGMQFQRCTAMIFVFSIPIIAIWWNSETLLKLVVPEHEKQLVHLAQTYLRYITFGTPGYIFFETGKRFLQAQGIFTAGQYSLFLVAPINLILNYVLVWSPRFGVGFVGAPISTAISYWLMSLFLLGYTYFVDGKKCWNGIQLQAFDIRQWSSMVWLALNGTAMLLSEFIAFEVLTLSASRFGTSSLASQSIVSSMATLAFQIPFGVSSLISSRMGVYIGGGQLANAKIVNKVAYLLSIVIGIINFSTLVGLRYPIAKAFTREPKIIALAVKIITILGINQLYDCPNVIYAGCLRAQGRQKVGSRLNLVAYYLIAIPLAMILAFILDLKLVGLWVGLGMGILALAISEAICLYKADWRVIVKNAKERNSE